MPSAAATIELEGPSSTTLTPPPARNTGMVVAFGLLMVAIVGVVGVFVARPELGHVVQAFVGDF